MACESAALQRRMFERSFGRPKNYFKLSYETQWDIDDKLGILDWDEKILTPEDRKRFDEHYDK